LSYSIVPSGTFAMISSRLVIAAIAQTTTVFALATPTIAATPPLEALTRKAQGVTVTLHDCSSAIGTIINRQGDLYSVLVPISQIDNPQKTCWVKLPDGDLQKLIHTPNAGQMRGFDLTLMKFKSDRDYAVTDLKQVTLPNRGETIYLAATDTADPHQLTLTTVEVTADLEQSDRLTYQTPVSGEVSLGRGPIFNEKGQAIGFQTSNQEGIAISPSLAMLLYSPQVPVDSLPLETSLPDSLPSPTQPDLPAAARPQGEKKAPTPKPKVGQPNSFNAALKEAQANTLTEEEKANLSQQMLMDSSSQKAKSGFPIELLLTGVILCGVVALMYRL